MHMKRTQFEHVMQRFNNVFREHVDDDRREQRLSKLKHFDATLTIIDTIIDAMLYEIDATINDDNVDDINELLIHECCAHAIKSINAMIDMFCICDHIINDDRAFIATYIMHCVDAFDRYCDESNIE